MRIVEGGVNDIGLGIRSVDADLKRTGAACYLNRHPGQADTFAGSRAEGRAGDPAGRLPVHHDRLTTFRHTGVAEGKANQFVTRATFLYGLEAAFCR